MRKVIASLAAVAGAFALPATALAAPPEKTEAFVCPTITNEAVGEHSPQAVPLGDTGDYTIAASTTADSLYIPVNATNGDGTGVPKGEHAVPGNTDYTAIWANQ